MATFATTRALGEKEGLTIVVSWPKGIIHAPTPAEQAAAFARDNPSGFIAGGGLLLVFAYYIIVWLALGRYRRPGTIIPLYAPPEGFSPAAVRYLMKMGFDDKTFAAALIDLAVKGAIGIEQEGKVYTLQRKSSESSGLSPDEKAALTPLFGSHRESLRLEQSHHEIISSAKDALRSTLAGAIDKVYFVRNRGYWLVGLLLTLPLVGISLLGSRQLPAAAFLMFWLSFWTLGTAGILWAQLRFGAAGSGRRPCL